MEGKPSHMGPVNRDKRSLNKGRVGKPGLRKGPTSTHRCHLRLYLCPQLLTMDLENATGQCEPSLPFLLAVYYLWTWLCSYVTSSTIKFAVTTVSGLRGLVPASVWLYITGIPHLLYHLTITPRYQVKAAGLTTWAQITGQSFIIRRPDGLLRFIAQPSCKQVRTFSLTPDDVHHIYSKTGIHPLMNKERTWHPSGRVSHYLTQPNRFHQATPPSDIDITSHTIAGSRLVQGQGLIGHKIYVALIEEYGRWPGEEGVLAARVFSWEDDVIHHARISVGLMNNKGVKEVLELEDGICAVHEWQDLEAGFSQGPRITAYILDITNSPNVSFVTQPSDEDE
jgi:hypothetical protein